MRIKEIISWISNTISHPVDSLDLDDVLVVKLAIIDLPAGGQRLDRDLQVSAFGLERPPVDDAVSSGAQLIGLFVVVQVVLDDIVLSDGVCKIDDQEASAGFSTDTLVSMNPTDLLAV